MQHFSPLNFFDKSNVSSRPDRRRAGANITLENLRAIPFVGSWSQNKQNIPGYYGFGYALEKAYEKYGNEAMDSLYRHSLFFRTLVENSQMVLRKSDFRGTAHAATSSKFSEIWGELHLEFERSKKNLLRVSGSNDLMEKNPKDLLSVSLREELIKPLLVIQQYALSMYAQAHERGNQNQLDQYSDLIIHCSFGLVNATRNSV